MFSVERIFPNENYFGKQCEANSSVAVHSTRYYMYQAKGRCNQNEKRIARDQPQVTRGRGEGQNIS